jgi:catechol 2,3-dioxygenase-like lactoylglutathione lyase family enzyme
LALANLSCFTLSREGLLKGANAAGLLLPPPMLACLAVLLRLVLALPRFMFEETSLELFQPRRSATKRLRSKTLTECYATLTFYKSKQTRQIRRREGLSMAAVQVRYIVHDVDAAIGFYTRQLDFKLEMHPAPPFAMLSRGELRLVLSAPNPAGGGGQSMPDGTKPEPGGWNRFTIEVSDLVATVDTLRKAGAHFRNDIVTGVGGKQILVDDPSGNPIELFQPTVPEARLTSAS